MSQVTCIMDEKGPVAGHRVRRDVEGRVGDGLLVGRRECVSAGLVRQNALIRLSRPVGQGDFISIASVNVYQ